MTLMRLQRALARAGVASRRKAEDLIRAGRVRVDGQVATIGMSVDPASQKVTVDGRSVRAATRTTWIALNKPIGYVVTRRDPEGRQTVFELVPDVPGLTYVGRLDVMKDHETFLRAAAQIARQHDNVRFVCIGNGDARYGEAMRALSCDIGLADRVLWLPAQTDMNAVYNALDIVCSSSAFGEGFPNVVGEAMACGVLCVVTDVGDSAMLVGDETFVVPPRDPVRLASRIDHLLSVSTTERNEIRARLRRRVVEQFSVARLTIATETALLGLLDGPER